MAETEGVFYTPPERKGSITDNAPESGKITQNWKVFQPEGARLVEEPGRQTGIFIDPGWAVPEWGTSVRDIGIETATFTGLPVIAQEIRSNPTKLSLREGAELDRRFIEQQGYTNVFILANSQGGVRAGHLIDLLQEKNPKIHINGGIFIEPKGLGDHKRPSGNEELGSNEIPPNIFDKLTKPNSPGEPFQESEANFLARLMEDPGSKIIQNPRENSDVWPHAVRMQSELAIDFLRQVIEARGNIAGGVRNLRSEMVRRNPALSRIKCPIVLVLGEGDTQVNPHFVVNPEMDAESAREYARWMEEIPENSKNSLLRNEVMAKREQYVHELLFPNSSAVKVLIASKEKHGHHALLGFRTQEVIRTSFAALERLNRRNREFQSKEEFQEYIRSPRRFTQQPSAKK